jgi:uncharacterized repeat protein (TIGR01451 family)
LATPSQGTYASGVWIVGTVLAGATPTLQIEATVVSPGAATNTATISRSDQFDPDPGNNSAGSTVTPQQSDLALTKTVNDPTPNVGDTVTFTVTLSNNGPDAATNVSITDVVPAGLSLVTATPSQGTYSGGVWTVGTVTTSAAQTLTLTALVVSPGVATNTASVRHADQFDPDPTNNQSSATVTPQQSDLALAKTVNDPTPNVGETVTFTVTLTNKGPDAATNVTVADALPPGLTLVSAAPSQGAYTGGVWTVGTVDPLANPTLTLSALVVSPTTETNLATVSHADQYDPDPANNNAAATVTPQQADLVVGKQVSNPTPNVGQTITYTVTVSNDGPNAATGVALQDMLPAGVKYQSSTATAGSYDPVTRTWTVGAVPVGVTETLTITALVTSPNPGANTASISHADQFDPNTNNNSDTASIVPQQSDLEMTKTVSNPTPNVGDSVIFTVTLTNNGPATATGVQVTDQLPPGLTLVSDLPSQGTYAGGVWTVGTVAAGAMPTLQITATVVSPGAATNTASISHADQFDPDPGNNSAGATVTPQQSDLELTKVVNDPTPNVGDTVTFTVSLTNLGPNPATNVSVADTLPNGLTLIGSNASQGTYTGGVWTVGTVDLSTVPTLTLTAMVVSPNAETNTATITHSDQFDPNTGNNSAGATVTPQQSDLVVGKRVSDPTPNVGDTITYTVTVTNDGPSTATGVTLEDMLPAGVTYQSSTATLGSYDLSTHTWTVGTVPVGATETLTITVVVMGESVAANTASISHSDQFDPDANNNSDTAPIVPQQSDLELTKVVSDPTPNVGDPVTFTITLTNNGPSTATGVQVADQLPSGLSLVQATPSQGTYMGGVWQVGTVAAGAMPTLQIQATVLNPSPQTNTASISHSDQFDPDPGNNTAMSTVIPEQADLALTKTVNNPTPNVGDTVTFTITLTNKGPDAATNVRIADALPAGLTLVSATPSQGTYTGGVWNVGTVALTAAPTLMLTAKVVSPNAAMNTATISHADQYDPVPGNNHASATVTPQQANLVLSKTVSQAQVFFGMNVTYTFVIRNLGPNAATGVVVNDPFPAGLVFVSATVPSQGTYDPVKGIWTVGTLANGASATLQVTARVMTMGSVVNTARASAVQFDPVLANNVASVAVLGLNPAMVISKRLFLASAF